MKYLALVKLLGGKSLPTRWTAPVVKAIVLPAHAGTSAKNPPPGAGP